jgi:hypothetical protein
LGNYPVYRATRPFPSNYLQANIVVAHGLLQALQLTVGIGTLTETAKNNTRSALLVLRK